MSKFEKRDGHLPKLGDSPRARLLTHDELLATTRHSVAENLRRKRRKKIRKSSLEDFVTKRIRGAQINGVNVIAIDINHGADDVHPIADAYMNAEATQVNVLEYFEPQMHENRVYTFLQPRNTWRNRRVPPEERERVDSILPQFNSAEVFTEATKHTGKPVAVMDIGDKVSFLATAIGMRMVPNFVEFGLSVADVIPGNLGTFALASTWLGVLTAQEMLDRGIYNKDKVTLLDNLALDFDPARRLFLGKGIEQLTRSIQADGGSDDAQIAVFYPRAHSNRALDVLLHDRPVTNRMKSGLYKATAPWLSYSTKVWEYKGAVQEEPGQRHWDGWIQTSKQRIRM